MASHTIPINIKIDTEIEDENGNESISKTEKGSYVHKGNIHMIKYDEQMEDLGFVVTTIVIQDDRISVKREGPLQMHQVFRIGASTECVYYHPYGKFRMETTTHRMQFVKGIGNRSGKIYMNYDVTLNDQEPRRHVFELHFQEEDAE
ncbi:DUF1934 domain-containing protein [Tenuibacillus multivorans]|uniref:Uncharacterized beta-barrel protein YwiB, DUF1934 family n=1 Tax=Tenuibacillus multivorans TaxID=237069 RepID=A0A1G9WY26_9BACI|nr:DUF1934 domain-containing protein [Tenuibacillus multivorans]GEL77312.1 hypothetical protein TMU01_15470 [Tenuibacillus multivorans]SDM89191.1 Uncharacterized beta-barrel protein YwiB, DUF1934 family [Tenuibacillus multivorans]